MPNGANEFTIEELESLFNDENQQATPPAQETTETQSAEDTSEPAKENDVTTTKAFATRLKESTTKARLEEREAIAKTFGYESYDAMVKARERKTYEEKGLDPDEVSPVVDELVKQRLNDDPRMQELEEFRKQQILEFGKKELAEITRLTGGQVTKSACKIAAVKCTVGGTELDLNQCVELQASMETDKSDPVKLLYINSNGDKGCTFNSTARVTTEKQCWP